MSRPRMTRPSALVLLALSLDPQPVPALADRLAARGEFLTEAEVRGQLQRLVRDGHAAEGRDAGQPVYALAAAADEGLDLAWGLVSP